MGLRYKKSINLGGGFRVNLSKNGARFMCSKEAAADKLNQLLNGNEV